MARGRSRYGPGAERVVKYRETGMNRSGYVPPLRPSMVAEMGLTLGPVCDVRHRPGMKPHRHIELPKTVTHDR